MNKISTAAQRFRESDPDLTEAQAFDRAWTRATHEDREAFRREDQAQFAERKDEEHDPWAGREKEKGVYDQIVVKANELRGRDSSLTEAQAFDRVWSESPALQREYRVAQLTDRQPKPAKPAPTVAQKLAVKTSEARPTSPAPRDAAKRATSERGIVLQMNDAQGIRRKVFVSESLARQFNDAA